jgi:hypothetical protein
VVEHILALGGEVELHRKLCGLRVEGRRLTGAVFAEPDPDGHELSSRPPGQPVFERFVPTRPATRLLDTDFDHLICTIPATAFQELNAGDDGFWRIPDFAHVPKLRGVAPMALQIWHRASVTRRYPGVITGLEGPLPVLHDVKHTVRDYRQDPRYGAVLYFAGQETGYEHLSDEDHLALCLKNVARLPGYESIDRGGVLHFQVLRHRAAHKRYFYTEPGVQRFRPHLRTSIENLWLAGDWVRSQLDFPCMETAVRTGLAAADAVLKKLG